MCVRWVVGSPSCPTPPRLPETDSPQRARARRPKITHISRHSRTPSVTGIRGWGSIPVRRNSMGSYASNAVSAIPYTLRVGSYGPYEQKRKANLGRLITNYGDCSLWLLCMNLLRKRKASGNAKIDDLGATCCGARAQPRLCPPVSG